MLKIIDGYAFAGKPSANRWAVSVLDLGAGHVEASIRRCTDWEEVPLDPDWRAKRIERVGLAAYEREEALALAERQAANLVRAARRAKTRVRRLCKAQGLDTLLTLTYRANQTDLALCKRHLKEFVRRMRRVLGDLGGFAFVACFEQQKRGAWHVHLAVHRLPPVLPAANGVRVKSFNVCRAIWRAVVCDLGGNIDVSKRKRSAQASAAKVAAYLSKYMLKAFADGESHSNRYSASEGVELPAAVRVELVSESLADLCALVFCDVSGPGCQLVVGWVSPFGDGAFFASERAGPASLPRDGV